VMVTGLHSKGRIGRATAKNEGRDEQVIKARFRVILPRIGTYFWHPQECESLESQP
jgi:hypothetical protein